MLTAHQITSLPLCIYCRLRNLTPTSQMCSSQNSTWSQTASMYFKWDAEDEVEEAGRPGVHPLFTKLPKQVGLLKYCILCGLSFSSPSSKHSCSLPATIEKGFSVEGDNIQISICLELFKGGNLWSGLNHLEILRFQHIYSHFFSQRTYSTHSWSDSSYKHTNLLSVLGLSYILKKKCHKNKKKKQVMWINTDYTKSN